MGARERFVQTRQAVIELDTIQALIATDGDDWQPEQVGAQGNADPTAARAIRNVTVWSEQLTEYRKREEWLLEFIGTSLAIIEGVRCGLGDKYAAILDQRYIDCLQWRDVEYCGERVSMSAGKRCVAIAFDWIDSLGVSAVIGGRFEL